MRTAVLAILLGTFCCAAGATILAVANRPADTVRVCLQRDFAARGIESDFAADRGEFTGMSPRGRYYGTFNGGRVRVEYRQVDEWNWELVSLEYDQ